MAGIPKPKAIMWAGFTIGGTIAAFFLPVLITITNLAVPFGIISPEKLEYARVVVKLSSPLAKLFLVVVLVGSLYHAAYRLQSVLQEITLEKLGVVSYIIAYGSLAVGTSMLLYAILAIG